MITYNKSEVKVDNLVPCETSNNVFFEIKFGFDIDEWVDNPFTSPEESQRLTLDTLSLVLEIIHDFIRLPWGEAVSVVASEDEMVLEAFTLEEVVSLESFPGKNTVSWLEHIGSKIMLKFPSKVIFILDLGIESRLDWVFPLIAPEMVQLYSKKLG